MVAVNGLLLPEDSLPLAEDVAHYPRMFLTTRLFYSSGPHVHKNNIYQKNLLLTIITRGLQVGPTPEPNSRPRSILVVISVFTKNTKIVEQ